jgi:hypothetical protein
MNSPHIYTFGDRLAANAIPVNSFAQLSKALAQIGLNRAHPTLVLVGGAGGISEADLHRLQQLFAEAIAPIVEKLGVIVVDGGTDAGIMRFIGQARTAMEGTFPLVGVVAVGTVILPDRPPNNPDAAPLEPNHTHFVLVPGTNWGDESPWLAQTASVLSEGYPSVTLVVNGGEITLLDVSYSVNAKRPAIALEGTGRTADKLAAALRGEATDRRAQELVSSGYIQAIDLLNNPAQLTEAIAQKLSGLFYN